MLKTIHLSPSPNFIPDIEDEVDPPVHPEKDIDRDRVISKIKIDFLIIDTPIEIILDKFQKIFHQIC